MTTTDRSVAAAARADVEVLTFPSGTGQCAAEHHRAQTDNLRTAAGVPYVVMAHGFGATVDSGLSSFARTFAAAGIGVLAFDYRGWGRSDGDPRRVVDVESQVADFRAALRAVRARADADPERLVAWGCSLAGGHIFRVAAEEPLLAAAIAVTPAVDGPAALGNIVRRDGVHALGSVAPALRDVVAAKRGRRPVTIPIVGEPGATAVITAPGAFAQYQAIAGPTWNNSVAARSMLGLARYRPGRLASRIRCPLLVQIADRDTISPVEPIRAAARRAPRSEVRHYPGDHFDVYPGCAHHDAVTAHQVAFLRRHLNPRQNNLGEVS
ncbi:alpha/beta hydrolase [Sporichthya brevicatena]|uniref:Alpha/beta hydrolase n=1 Tax=Sporichthya brevicatena TaxID=171442 RepID=A0ABN1GPQ2_9ACTN